MFCFTKNRRLNQREDYTRVFSEAKKIVTSEFVILHCKNSANSARIGFALSKKQIPKANQRNRIKRLLRESFRCATLPPVDIVILARPGSANAENATITNKLEATWKKLVTYYAESAKC